MNHHPVFAICWKLEINFCIHKVDISPITFDATFNMQSQSMANDLSRLTTNSNEIPDELIE